VINNIKKKIAYKILREFYRENNTLSVTLTGSYSDNFNLEKAGDIDVIVICKNLNKSYFNKCTQITKSFKKTIFKNKKEIVVNNTFGPIKFYKKNSIVFHIMIYDMKSHIDHTIKSPFTCYDWERSEIFIGKSLRELSPVHFLQLRDFYEARRNNKEYLKDILKGRISYREYNFKEKNVKINKRYFYLDKINKRDFIYHTIKFLLINLIKFEKNLNLKISKKEVDRKFFEITKNKKDLNNFQKLRYLKDKKSNTNINNPSKLAINFIKKYDQFINKISSSSKKLFFMRHKKTFFSKNIFLGQNLDPGIHDKIINTDIKKINFDLCISSPSRRSYETACLIFKKRILRNQLLREINYGLVEGLDFNNLKNKFPDLIKNWKNKKDPKFPKGESTSDVLVRVKKFLKFCQKNKKNKNNILIVTHNVFLRCLIGSKFKILKYKWYNIFIDYLDIIEFIILRNSIRPNIKRLTIFKIFNKFY